MEMFNEEIMVCNINNGNSYTYKKDEIVEAVEFLNLMREEKPCGHWVLYIAIDI